MITEEDKREIENTRQKIIFLQDSQNSVYRELKNSLNLNELGDSVIWDYIFNCPEYALEEYLDMRRQNWHELKTRG